MKTLKVATKGGKIIGEEYKLNITKPLAILEQQHNKYLANLPVWDRYIVWTYTLGSQPINRRLVGAPVSQKVSRQWAFSFFSNFIYGEQNISPLFQKLNRFFVDPNLFNQIDNDKKDKVAELVLTLYTENLQSIILESPKTVGDITVYKASTPYDIKLLENNFPFKLEQSPFNSTTYDPWFDFNAFLGSNSDTCCLWQITIPKGSHVLAITPSYQAYLIEREILLPYDSTFTVIGTKDVLMSYYEDREAPIRAQNGTPYIGELYRHDNWENRTILERPIRMLLATFMN